MSQVVGKRKEWARLWPGERRYQHVRYEIAGVCERCYFEIWRKSEQPSFIVTVIRRRGCSSFGYLGVLRG